MHAQQRLHDARGRLIQSILGHSMQLEPASEMALARMDRRLIQAREIHLMKLGVHQAADTPRGFAGPVEYRRLVPRGGDGRRCGRERRKIRVRRPMQWQALQRAAARRVVVSVPQSKRRRRQLEFAGQHRPERAQQASRLRPEGPARRRFVQCRRRFHRR